MKNKILLWHIVVSAYLSIIPLFVGLIAFSGETETNEASTDLLLTVSFAFGGVTLLLCFIHLIITLVGYSNSRPAPYAVTMAVKLALVPFYLLSFVLWILCTIAAIFLLNPIFFFIGGVLGVFIGLSVAGAYCVMLATGLQNIVYLIKLSIKERKVRYLPYIVLHFIFCADVVAAIMLYVGEKNALKAASAEAYVGEQLP